MLNTIHPLIRLVLPFIFVVPILLRQDLYLIYTLVFIAFIIFLVCRLSLIRILSRLKHFVPFIFLITVFIPFYIGSTVIFELYFGLVLRIYAEGLNLAILIFSRIFGVTFIFMGFYSAFTQSEFIEALSKIRLPTYFVGSFMIMLHYIPVFAESNRKILDAQELRGKKVTSYWQRIKAHAYIMGKTIVLNMERSEKLYDSLKMRGFAGRLSFQSKSIKIIDFIIFCVCLFIAIYLTMFINLEQFYLGVASLFF